MLDRFAVAAVLTLLVACNNSGGASFGSIPPRPDAADAARLGPETFAINAVFLGDTNRDGVAQVDAWRTYGYDLDDHRSTSDSKDVCALFGSAPPVNQNDGTGGIDNSFGQSLLPIIEVAFFMPSPSPVQTASIQSGRWTLEIQTDGLPSGGGAVVGVRAQIFVGAPLAGPPAFDQSTQWPALASSVTDGATLDGGAVLLNDDAYVTGDGTFVSHFATTEALMLPFAFTGFALALPMHDVVVSFKRLSGTELATGTIAGVLSTEEVVSAFRSAAGRISRSLCGAPFAGIADQIRQAQDILTDGTNRAGPSCDAISIGMGFTAQKIANPTGIVTDPPLIDPCADAGSDGSGTSD